MKKIFTIPKFCIMSLFLSILFISDNSFAQISNKAFGDNLIVVDSTLISGHYEYIFAVYSGDINQDNAVDATDFLELDPSIQNGEGGYLVGDINGDGAVDASDFLLMDPNIQNGVGATIPF